MTNASKVAPALLLLMILMASCGENPLLPELVPGAVKILAPPSGSFVAPGSDLAVNIQEEEDTNSWERLEAVLSDLEGQELVSWSLQRGQGPFSLEVPSALAGTQPGDSVVFRATSYRGTQTTGSLEETYFLVKNKPSISAEAEPAQAWPGSRAILDLQGSAPWGSSTWVRWTWKGQKLAEGPWSQNFRLKWDLPQEEGVYSLRAEIFPRPPQGGTYGFSSALGVEVPVVSTTRASLLPDELQPEDSYLVLYHFRGNPRDSRSEGNSLAQEVKGFDVARLEGFFGQEFSPGTGIFRTGELIPVDAQGGADPFSVNLCGVISQPGTLLEYGSAEPGVFLGVSPAWGGWTLDYTLGEDKGRILVDIPVTGKFRQTISVIPRDTGWELLWFFGAELKGFRQGEWNRKPQVGNQGFFRIAGKTGFSGVLDEAGIYFRDEDGQPGADTGLLAREIRSREGGGLVWAAGFDGIRSDLGFSHSKGAFLRRGALVLPPGERIQTPLVEAESRVFRLDIPEFSQGSLELIYEDFAGVSKVLGLYPPSGTSRSVVLNRGLGQNTGRIVLPGDGTRGFRLSFVNNGPGNLELGGVSLIVPAGSGR